jgi:hypothetical protein
LRPSCSNRSRWAIGGDYSGPAQAKNRLIFNKLSAPEKPAGAPRKTWLKRAKHELKPISHSRVYMLQGQCEHGVEYAGFGFEKVAGKLALALCAPLTLGATDLQNNLETRVLASQSRA